MAFKTRQVFHGRPPGGTNIMANDKDIDPEESDEFYEKCVDDMFDGQDSEEDMGDLDEEDEEDDGDDDEEDPLEDDEDPLEGDDDDLEDIDEKNIRTVCGWCKKVIKEAEDQENVFESHGICDTCEKKHFPEEKKSNPDDEDDDDSIMHHYYDNPRHKRNNTDNRGMNPDDNDETKKFKERRGFGNLVNVLKMRAEQREDRRNLITKTLKKYILVGVRFDAEEYNTENMNYDFYSFMEDYPEIIEHLINIPDKPEMRIKEEQEEREGKRKGRSVLVEGGLVSEDLDIEPRQDFGELVLVRDKEEKYVFYPQCDPDFFLKQAELGNVKYLKIHRFAHFAFVRKLSLAEEPEPINNPYNDWPEEIDTEMLEGQEIRNDNPWRPRGPLKNKTTVSILFSKNHFSKEEAEAWLRSHHYRSVVYGDGEDGNYYNAPQMKSSEVAKYRTRSRPKNYQYQASCFGLYRQT